MPSPNEFRDQARRCIETANRTSSARLKQILIEQAKVLARIALQLERSIALSDTSPDGFSRARTLDELNRELELLSPGGSVHMSTKQYCDLFPGRQVENAWAVLRGLGAKFRCEAQFRSNGTVWFVKRG